MSAANLHASSDIPPVCQDFIWHMFVKFQVITDVLMKT